MQFLGSGKGLLARRALVCALSAAAAQCAFAELSATVFSVTACNANGCGSFTAPYNPDADSPDGYFDLYGPIPLVDGGNGNLIAVLESGSLAAFGDPVIGMTFTVQAVGVPTAFNINSGTLSFPGILGAVGTASGGLTVTDSDANGFAASAGTGGATGVSSWAAYYNGLTQFAEDIGPITVLNVAGSQTVPYNAGPSVIPGVTTDIHVNFSFVLSGNDSASGTSVFSVVPEPASFMLLGLGCFAMLRRRA